jgi:hypothetical protein
MLAAILVSGCQRATPGGKLSSGAPNVFDFEWSCASMQHNFVNFGNKFEAAKADFIALQSGSATESLGPRGESVLKFLGVPSIGQWSGQLTPLLASLALPDGLKQESDCAGKSLNEDAYDACVEMVGHFSMVTEIAKAWDGNSSGRKCYEGPAYQKTDVVEFAYCDNECAFNSRLCTRCEVPSNDANQRVFVCKSSRTAVEAVGAFCRLKDGMCKPFTPASMCQRKPGIDFAGQGLRSIDGRTEHRKTYELAGYLGASEKVQVKAGVVAGQRVSARGTIKGRIGYIASAVGGDLFTRTGLTTAGAKVSCVLVINGIGEISYAYEAGIGGDFVLANGEAVIEAGGSFNLNKEYSKTSATWSAGGQTEEMILTQCMQNHAKRWIATEFTKYMDEYPGLEIVQKAIHRVILDAGFESQIRIPESSKVYCRYTHYSDKFFQTAGAVVYLTEPMTLQWAAMKHLGLDVLWPDSWSEKLTFDSEALRPFVRDLKNGTLHDQRLAGFFNDVVVPASKKSINQKWRMDSCFYQP